MTTKVCLVKAMVFPVVLYGCESWTIKKAESRRINAFELWRWRRLLRVSWTARRTNQSIQKKISPVYSLEGLMLKLKLQYFGHLMGRTDSSDKTLMLGKIEGRKRRGWQRMRWLDGITDSKDMSLSQLRKLVCCSPWGCKESDTTEWLNSTQLNSECISYLRINQDLFSIPEGSGRVDSGSERSRFPSQLTQGWQCNPDHNPESSWASVPLFEKQGWWSQPGGMNLHISCLR